MPALPENMIIHIYIIRYICIYKLHLVKHTYALTHERTYTDSSHYHVMKDIKNT